MDKIGASKVMIDSRLLECHSMDKIGASEAMIDIKIRTTYNVKERKRNNGAIQSPYPSIKYLLMSTYYCLM